MLVVDASVALFAASRADGFSYLAKYEPAAPPLMWSEALSVLREGQWRGVTSAELAVLTRDQLLNCPISRLSPPDLHREAWRVAEELGWAKTYDAEYVALARILGCRLVTVDERLRRGAGRVVDVIGPTEI